MDTYIYLKNELKPIIFSHTDWYAKEENNIVIVDEIDHNNVVGNFNRDNIAGVVSVNNNRLNKYHF